MTTAPPRQRQALSIASSVLTKATQQTLARRLLVTPQSNEDLPPLLSTQGLPPELDAELYDFIALALRAYVNPWWTKITRYDKEFLPHVTKIIIHVVSALEERMKAVDLPALVFHDVPTLVTQHYIDFRNAQLKLSTSYATGGASSVSQLFSQLQPHMAISTDGEIDPEYYRQILDIVLKLLLPSEDHEPEVERTAVREVLVKVLVNDIFPKISQPWFIHKVIIDLLGPQSEESLYAPQPTAQTTPPESSFFHNFLVLVLSGLQSFSGLCLALMQSYKQTVSTIKLVNQSPDHSPRLPTPTVLLIKDPPEPLTLAPPVVNSRSLSATSAISSGTEASTTPPDPSPDEQKDYLGPPLDMVAEIARFQDRYTSTLLVTTLSMLSLSMITFLDKLCVHMLFRFLSPIFILNIVRLSKRTLFPNGYPGPQPVEPTPEEQAELRQILISWRPKGAISHLLPLFLSAEPSATMETAIEPLSDAKCNTRLFVFLLDRVLVALFPELVK
ncbi:hypothetical protein FA15DRAFT_662669 [Coprinopsis marcescibilis]|uniref:PXA domain-containing protein n=1 Tax=Coprinopsis marcescibilis TaxID=230819 RepID=A0A5C3LDC1_COPMA|nr:hypothetical protein FA15DRAFT_662669 [Coprinopsis marcescibilis]